MLRIKKKEQKARMQNIFTDPGQIKVLLRGVERIWEHRERLKGPGQSQDQQGNQNHRF